MLLLGAVIAAGCGGDPPTTPDSTPPGRSTETFGATLPVGQSQFYSFTTISAGTTDITLVSLRPTGNPRTTLNTVVGLGLGVPQGTDCALSNAITAAPGLKSQLSVSTNITTYCVKIADVGNLAVDADYTVRVIHP